MDKLTPTARWTKTQPWRGLFGVAVTVGYTFLITAIFDLKAFNGFFTLLICPLSLSWLWWAWAGSVGHIRQARDSSNRGGECSSLVSWFSLESLLVISF